MYWKETGGVEKLFSLPSRIIPAKALFINYQRHTISHFTPLEDFLSLAPSDVLALDQFNNDGDAMVALSNKRSGRKRKADQTLNNANIEAVTTLSNNLSTLEEMREQRSVGQSSELIGNNGVDLEAGAMDTMSHVQSYDYNDVGVSDNLGSMGDIAYTPLNLNHGMDISDDCNTGNMTPGHRHAENSSPQHHDIESIQSIPNLPADQVSSILNEAENMPHCSQDSGLLNLNKTLVSDWSDMNFPVSIELEVYIFVLIHVLICCLI